MTKREEIMQQSIGTYRSKNGDFNITLHDLEEIMIDDVHETYVILSYKDDLHNVFLQEKVFPEGECPYNTDKIEKVPYFVIENEVYYLDDAFDISIDDDE